MRFILWAALVLGLAWGGYWFLGARAVEQGAAAAFAEAAARGLGASNEGLSVQGFANRFDLTVTRPRLSDPATGLGWTAPFAQIYAMSWKPWHVIAKLPADQEIDLGGDPVAVTSSRMEASLRLSPNRALTFSELVIDSQDLGLKAESGWTLALASAVLALAAEKDTPRDYRLGIEVTDLSPDPTLTKTLPELGPVISRLHLDATLPLTAELDRAALENPPQLSGLTVSDLRLDWGVLHLAGKGTVSPGPDGLAEGEIALEITGWRQLPLLAVALGLITNEMATSVTDGLAALAAADGDPESLSLPLVLKDGWTSLGPLPLGPAPVLSPRN